jgi:nicotinamide-nucleotide amidase
VNNQQIQQQTEVMAEAVAQRLQAIDAKLVLAESCTAGLISAVLAHVPGISRYFCGSAVTYREATKIQWLGVDPRLIAEHSAVSGVVTEAMAKEVLDRCDEASISLAITGHLESEATDLGSHIYFSIGHRSSGKAIPTPAVRKILNQQNRVMRQWEAAQHALSELIQYLDSRKNNV